VHDFQHDPVEDVLVAFLALALCAGIAVLCYSVFRYRGRIVDRVAWAVLIAGVFLLPAMSVSFGTLLVFQRAEKNEFCASCHLTMQVYLDDMLAPDSESMAAIHYKNRYIPKNQCYDCHTSYGLFGTLEAKQKGLMDVYKYYTRTYEIPIQLRQAYPNGDCLKCHADAVKWNEQEMHAENKEALFNQDVACMDCHGPMGHPAHILPEVSD